MNVYEITLRSPYIIYIVEAETFSDAVSVLIDGNDKHRGSLVLEMKIEKKFDVEIIRKESK